MQHSEINLPHGDIFCMSSFDGICSLGKDVIDSAKSKRRVLTLFQAVPDPLSPFRPTRGYYQSIDD
jgi:hypothetical protein